jgi:hypothetical protein
VKNVIAALAALLSVLAAAPVARAAGSSQRYVVVFAPGESRDRRSSPTRSPAPR